MCVNEIDLLTRCVKMASEEIMRHCLDVEGAHDRRQKGWKAAAKELFKGSVSVSELVRLDRKLTHKTVRRSVHKILRLSGRTAFAKGIEVVMLCCRHVQSCCQQRNRVRKTDAITFCDGHFVG